MSRSSPEEEEEEIEEALPIRRSPMPESVTKEFLRASASRSSRAGTSQTPTPRANKEGNRPQSGLESVVTTAIAKPRIPTSLSSISSRPNLAEEEGREDPASVTIEKKGTEKDGATLSDDSSVIEIVPRAGPSRHSHGPPKQSSEPLLKDARTPSSHVSPPPVNTDLIVRTRKYKGAPIVEISYLPLLKLKKYPIPENCRHPTPVARNHQIRFLQTPPASSGDSGYSSEESQPTKPVRPTRTVAPKKFPSRRTRNQSFSSADLGGYGSSESTDEVNSGDSDSGSDLVTRRATRSKGKRQQVDARRTTRANNKVCVCTRMCPVWS